MSSPVLRAERLTLGYGERTIVSDLDLEIPSGKVTAIVGPNGCGKSTLLRGLSRLLRPKDGRVLLGDQDVHRMPTKQVARAMALLPQSPVVPEGITVGELVARGRHPHHGLLRQWTREDDEVVAEALDLTGTTHLVSREVAELSGGQRQRVWIAMVLAQRTDLLLLDEPTSFLDIAHQVEVLDLARDLSVDRGTTVVMVLHDLAMAARYADHLVAMRGGRVIAQGAPREVVTAETVCDVFGITCRVLWQEATGDLSVIPLGRHRPVGHVLGTAGTPRIAPEIAPELEVLR
ncbi:ABC transporter ATP-binding protein [Ornithinimicrobium humiphilum]|uniref:Iron complex transport system ATP-binding protein n=2 Tax=Ornithinimicrobium humiphilum TaxID=125288 RepID=A0A543K830_9MICO|nr:ABC transporter ATP-binding protein [Ornithinimicrobium humiphilum]TQM91242.1 iron complex transport system ATP-binding protein [Ornithinimicrobium humiphilum]